jgi:hypothetical protein
MSLSSISSANRSAKLLNGSGISVMLVMGESLLRGGKTSNTHARVFIRAGSPRVHEGDGSDGSQCRPTSPP